MTTPILTYRHAGRDRLLVDLPKLIASKLLLQAASGGGKSWAVRQLAEELFGKVPIIIIDPEGEFHTLREKYDFVLAAVRGGDVEASVKTAPILARRLIEARGSAVIDLSEMKPREQRQFVRIFLETLIGLPRDLWHPTIVVVDEAHIFGPESGHGEAESLDAMSDFGTRARKRGFCFVCATTRIAKLHKDIVANLHNKLIGFNSLDVDIDRAAKELGFAKEGKATIRQLDPGTFYAYGPAISKEVTLVRTGPVETTHPKPGMTVAVAAVPPSSKIKALIASSLADLPREAEEEARTIDELRRANADLTRQVRAAAKAAPAPVSREGWVTHKTMISQIDASVGAARRESAKTITNLRKALEAAMQFIIKVSAANFDVAGVDKSELERAIQAAVSKATAIIDQRVESRTKAIDALRLQSERVAATLKAVLEDQTVEVSVQVEKNEPFTVATPKPRVARPAAAPRVPSSGESGDLSGVERKIVNTLAWFESLGVAQPDRVTVAVLCGYSNLTSKSFANAIGSLRTAGRIEYPDAGRMALTDEGRSVATVTLDVSSLDELHRIWFNALGGVAERILKPLIAAYPNPMEATEVMESAGYSNATSKSFANMKGRLRTLGLIKVPTAGALAATDLLFPEGLA